MAAHIKPRSRCSAAEKKRVDDNVMGVCVLGCDALFERGIVYVQQDGKVQSAASGALTQSLTEHVSKLVGRVCTAWTPASERFFAWHAGHHEAIRRRTEAQRLGT
ncbi:MAG: hypothetical protein ABS52_01610 [Gemmatimonadetes bacterium SCN 70-22]|nr:MAG: hypothetical protein ABS52_01610 [Gemmatimonadetes bacterium SCN 70-22]